MQQQVTTAGLTLKVYDCYRPQRSVDAFVAWAKDLDDTRMKAEFYPRVARTGSSTTATSPSSPATAAAAPST